VPRGTCLLDALLVVAVGEGAGCTTSNGVGFTGSL
jgi:hypothetical protein